MNHLKKAEITKEYKELYSLRYKVYCLEKAILNAEDYPDKKEKDIFDAYATHYIAMNSENGIVGTIRFIIDSNSPEGLPVMDHPGISSKRINALYCAEISRFAVAAGVRAENIFLGFFRMIYQESIKKNINSWILNIEPKFYYLLNDVGFKLVPLGALGQHMGNITIPAKWDLSDAEGSLRLHNPLVYEWLHDDAATVKDEKKLSYLLMPAQFSNNNVIAIAKG
ncbi:MAG: GNAT family N-acetyltransferase [Candidatus Aureabacteria bacterium]|nr:GNAT family N-acetyltransferase [Candidatus Auribacterota bacterium]